MPDAMPKVLMLTSDAADSLEVMYPNSEATVAV
jgi:hypothetical protein